MQNALVGKRVLITQATAFMGPVLCEVFAEQGATVVASSDALAEPGAAERIVRASTLAYSALWRRLPEGWRITFAHESSDK